MKLVVESLNDVLKPKSSKEIQPAIEKAIINTQNSFSMIADEIESLQDSDGWPLEMWDGRKNQVMNLSNIL
ncbi:MAG: hypothetical protein GYA51_18920 [Candidatus Methanofastidiosa archaeon]|jgi:hypothetical protein|nr:hypothetical protein [Candidatus Methanofastidiosa archaeon]